MNFYSELKRFGLRFALSNWYFWNIEPINYDLTMLIRKIYPNYKKRKRLGIRIPESELNEMY